MILRNFHSNRIYKLHEIEFKLFIVVRKKIHFFAKFLTFLLQVERYYFATHYSSIFALNSEFVEKNVDAFHFL